MITEQTPSSILTLLIVQLIASCGMLGVIWFVQLITYPQFAEIGEAEFVEYHQHYSNRVTWIVAPLMLIELGTAFLITVHFWKSPLFALALVGFLLVIALWALTAFVQVPQHTRLSYGYSLETIHDLVRGNWARTILWSTKVILTAALIHRFVFS